MADLEHLTIIKQGANSWNKWRKENPHVFHKDLSGADLRGADLSEANLLMANLLMANLNQANLSEANLKNVVVGWTNITNIDMRNVKGLETINHEGPSSIGIDTIFKSDGKIPHKFLQDAGVPDIFIEYMGSLTGQAFQFYSCFISHSTKDKEFADRIYADLRKEGVRCWFAPEDMKTGDKIRQRLDESIRLYDKLLIVLSANSINSKWVEKEVETAFEKETKEKTVLFPVRLDNSVMETDESWAADIRRTRHVGDFTNWKDHASYQKAFKRLLRDLQADEK